MADRRAILEPDGYWYVYDDNDEGRPFFETKDEGRARLTAAAPDLLAACKDALGAFTNNNAIDWSDLERAIAKAEGR